METRMKYKTTKGCLGELLKEESFPLPVELIFEIIRWTYGRLKELYKWLRKRIAKWKKECYRFRGKENIECNLSLVKETRKKLEMERKNCEGEDCKQIDAFLKKLDKQEAELNMKLKAYK